MERLRFRGKIMLFNNLNINLFNYDFLGKFYEI
jgi:hypothetical protein